MGLLLTLKVGEGFKLNNTIVRIRKGTRASGSRISLHFEGPDKVTRVPKATNESNDSITKEK